MKEKKVCKQCVYGSLGRCINCGDKGNWVVNKIYSTKGVPIFIMNNGSEEFIVENPKMIVKKQIGTIESSNMIKVFRCTGCYSDIYVPIRDEKIPQCSMCDTIGTTGTQKEFINVFWDKQLLDN